MTPTATNKIVSFDESLVRAIGNALIVKNTGLFASEAKSEGGIYLPDSTIGSTKKYNVGVVVSRGKKVEEVDVGDVVVYQTATAAGVDPIPNGAKPSILFKIVETSLAIVCRVPKNDVEEWLANQAGNDEPNDK